MKILCLTPYRQEREQIAQIIKADLSADLPPYFDCEGIREELAELGEAVRLITHPPLYCI